MSQFITVRESHSCDTEEIMLSIMNGKLVKGWVNHHDTNHYLLINETHHAMLDDNLTYLYSISMYQDEDFFPERLLFCEQITVENTIKMISEFMRSPDEFIAEYK